MLKYLYTVEYYRRLKMGSNDKDNAWYYAVLTSSFLMSNNTVSVIFCIQRIWGIWISEPVFALLFFLPIIIQFIFVYNNNNLKNKLILKVNKVPILWKIYFWIYVVVSYFLPFILLSFFMEADALAKAKIHNEEFIVRPKKEEQVKKKVVPFK